MGIYVKKVDSQPLSVKKVVRKGRFMPRISPISAFDKDLLERVFFVFAHLNDTEIAEKVGAKRQTIQGWRSGMSRPTLDHLNAMTEASYIDWSWLATGKTTSAEALSYAYFPYFYNKKLIINAKAYKFARHYASIPVICYTEKGYVDIYAHVTGLFLHWAQDKKSQSPFKACNVQEGDFQRKKSIDAFLKMKCPLCHVEEARTAITRMMDDYTPSHSDLLADALQAQDKYLVDFPDLDTRQDKKKPSTVKAEGKELSSGIKDLLLVSSTVEMGMRQCLVEAAVGKIPEPVAIGLFSDLFERVRKFREENDLSEIEQQTIA